MALIGCLALGAAGCQPGFLSPGKSSAQNNTTTDRLIAAYEDLASKKFQIIADFEAPEQGTLFHIEEPESPGSAAMTTERARTETGVGSLKMSFARAKQRVVAAEQANSKWTLYRDWSKYRLMIFSVFSPRKLGGFNFSISSGADRKMTYENPRVLLEQGWNLIRLDLGDISDRVDLGDIRQIAWTCDPLDTPIDLYLDDVLLADNTREIFSTKEREPGDLYVRRQGRQLAVGSVARFELVFSHGRIRQWFDLGHDPARNRNLVGAGTLGPTPIVVPGSPGAKVALDDPDQWSPLGSAVEVYQSMIEANPLRIIVRSEWRFGSGTEPPGQNGPAHHWVYTIYGDGRVYVRCDGTAKTATFDPPNIGVVFCCDGDQGFQRTAVESTTHSPSPSNEEAAYTLFHRDEERQADLLVVPFHPSPARFLENAGDSRLCVMYSPQLAGDSFSFAGMLRVWPTDLNSPLQAAPMAADYAHPFPLAVEAGRLVRTDPSDPDNDGYCETQGTYVLQLDGSTARVQLDGRQHLRFSPVFKLVDVADRDVWVYINGKLLRDTYRDGDKNLLFAVPDAIAGETLIEITSRKQGQP